MLRVFDINLALHQTALLGATLIPKVLKSQALSRLKAEIAAAPLRDPKPSEKVLQQHKFFSFSKTENTLLQFPLLQTLGSHTEKILRSAPEFPMLRQWQANSVAVHQYGADGCLGAHQDYSRDIQVIAIFTVTGSCLFEILRSRSGPTELSLNPWPGDLVLLRAPGLTAAADDRPFHRVSGNTSWDEAYRVSIIYRHERGK